jgi:hypothetical protein
MLNIIIDQRNENENHEIYPPLEWLLSEKQIVLSAGEDVEMLEHSYTAGMNVNGAVALENSLAIV